MTTKRHTRGTHRVSSLEETRARIWPLLRPLGITRVANITGLDCIGIPVVAVYRPNARSLSVAQGKGCTLLAAEVSGAMESIEFYHAENISLPLLLGSYNQLRFSHPLLDPQLLPKSVVGRWGVDRKLPWISGVDLIEQSETWVPFELVHTDFTLPLPSSAGCFPMTSNGLASGNHLWEAVAHGLAEVVERDAATMFSLLADSERDARRIDPATVELSECQDLLARFARADVDVALFDMTADTDLAVIRAVIVDGGQIMERPLGPSTGTGCHPSRDVALLRALTEAAQARLTVIAGSRDDLPRERYVANDEQQVRARREAIFRGPARRSFLKVPHFHADDVGDDIAFMKEKLMAVGIDHIVVVDLTKPELGIPVARVIVPGLEPSRDLPGWTPGPRARALLGGRVSP